MRIADRRQHRESRDRDPRNSQAVDCDGGGHRNQADCRPDAGKAKKSRCYGTFFAPTAFLANCGELWGWVVHSRKPLAGYKFLIIEDEPMQAWRIGEILADLGGVVGKIAYSYEQGQEALAYGKWDCVIVDINLNGEPSFPLVKIIEKQGVPYIYCSAYIEALVGIFPEAESAVRVSKPVTPEKLQSAVLLALSH